MKNNPIQISAHKSRHKNIHGILKYGIAAVHAVALVFLTTATSVRAQNTPADEKGAQVLTRGPVHEAFAGIVSFNSVPGVIVEKAPPQAIEEVPPSERPAGDNISWIPGYWAWDDESSDYLWVSGTWRALPPGRQWTPGYWTEAEGGHQWISGYWANSKVRETTYLPKPPDTIEVGPNIAAPSSNYGWTPGSWMWQQERYAWRPGYWAEGRSDWDWVPAHYVWSPRGYIYVEGYWDYSVERRGVLYAPVRFQSDYYSRSGFQYSPVIAIGLAALIDNLFLRPNYHHYYFGDYYDRRYSDQGYYTPFAYQNSRYGYDPVYSHRSWTHRADPNWQTSYAASYNNLRDNVAARPPRTWADQQKMALNSGTLKNQQLMAAPIDQLAKNSQSPIRLQAVSTKEKQKMTDQSREVRKSREQRQLIETNGVKVASETSGREIKPSKVMRPSSPIVGKSSDKIEKFPKNQIPPSTKAVESNPKNDSPDKKKDTQRDPQKDNNLRDPQKDIQKHTQKEQPQPKNDPPARQRESVPQSKDSERKVRPEITKPEITKPEVTRPKVTRPEVTRPEVTRPEVTRPEVTRPKVTIPEITRPSKEVPAAKAEKITPQRTRNDDRGDAKPPSAKKSGKDKEPSDSNK